MDLYTSPSRSRVLELEVGDEIASQFLYWPGLSANQLDWLRFEHTSILVGPAAIFAAGSGCSSAGGVGAALLDTSGVEAL